MTDEQLIAHLYQLFQESQKQGSNEGIFKGLRGLQSFSESDFAKVCREFHILDKYRGAMTRTLGSPKQLRAKKEPLFRFKKEPIIQEYEPTPMTDTVRKVVKLSLDHWRNNMVALRGRNKLRKYIQGTIWGRIGKLFSAKAFEEWHVIIMTKKLYDKREELRAIFGRDSVKRIFKCWVDYVYVEVDPQPVPGLILTGSQDIVVVCGGNCCGLSCWCSAHRELGHESRIIAGSETRSCLARGISEWV